MPETTNEINDVVPCMSSHYDTNLLAEELYLKVPPKLPLGQRLRGVFVDEEYPLRLEPLVGPTLHYLAAAYTLDDPQDAVADHLVLLRSPHVEFLWLVERSLRELVYARERLAGRWSERWGE